jgi:cytochrome P450
MPAHTVTGQVHQYSLMTRVFGAQDSHLYMDKRFACWETLTKHVERLFLNDATTTAMLESSNIPLLAASLVSFSSNPEKQQRWERSANIRVIAPETSQSTGIVEADLLHLARDFGACLAIDVLYGKDFLRRNPGLLEDFWRFDNDIFILLILGIPSWAPFSIMKKGIAARTRLHQALDGVYKRTEQYMKGEQVDFDADMSDISACVKGRSETYIANDYSTKERGQSDLGLLWGANANTQPMVFWFLAYAYSIPGLKDELRKEHEPYLTFATGTDKPSLAAMDISRLTRECPLTKSCLFEVYRLANDATSIRYVHKPLNLRDGPHMHAIQPGTFLSTPHGIHQRDPDVYENPESFKPDRFLETDEKTGKRSARYGKLKPWGGGVGICKGRTFAEKEIITLCVAIMAVWEIAPADGRWKMPGMIPGTGAMQPSEEIRVRITRRENW